MTSIVDIASPEEVALFNPAFLARLLRSTAADFENSAERGLPIALGFLAIPLVLHRPTRDDLPVNAASQMQKWIREHPRHLSQLDNRVLRMRPFVGRSVEFGVRHGVLTSSAGDVSAGSVRRRSRGQAELESNEVAACIRSASFLGRWFARQGDTATLLALWGFRP